MFLRCLSILTACVLLAVTPPFLNAQEPAAPALKLETAEQKAAYGIGLDIGRDLKRQGLDLDPQLLLAGITAALKGDKPALTQDEVNAAFQEVRTILSAKKTEAGKKFLDDHKKKEGVKTTKSGLQYVVVKEGNGATPKTSSTVTAHYRGTLINGDVFDESYSGEAPGEQDEARSFPVTRVIKGWTEALQLMKVGAHYRLVIPSELAYGEDGPPGIGPNAVLLFEIYLVGSEG